jgi:transposase-like protein
LKAEGLLPQVCDLRHIKYLNTIIEQDHRRIKRRTKPSMGFVSFQTAEQTLQGYECMHMIRKGQIQGNCQRQLSMPDDVHRPPLGVGA